MQVLLVTAGEPEAIHTLASGPARGVGLHMGPAGFSHNSRKLVQTDATLRGAYTKPRDRGNLTTQFAFSVKVECESIEAAGEYVLLYPINRTRKGTLRFLLGAGETQRKIEFADAEVETADVRHVGVSVEISYRILCGAPIPNTYPNDVMEGEQAAETELQGQAAAVTEIQGEHAAETEVQGQHGATAEIQGEA
jgi:hypothetical protein